jgi:hypothetical protein
VGCAQPRWPKQLAEPVIFGGSPRFDRLLLVDARGDLHVSGFLTPQGEHAASLAWLGGRQHRWLLWVLHPARMGAAQPRQHPPIP